MSRIEQALDNNPLGLTRAGLLMANWGVLLLLAGVIVQWWPLPSIESRLAVWGIATLLGLFVQGVEAFRYVRGNLTIWAIALLAGWGFTLYAAYRIGSLFVYVGGAWLLLQAVAFAATGRQIDRRFFLLAALNAIVGTLVLLSAGKMVTIPFLDSYASLVLGVMAGATLIPGAAMSRVRRKSQNPAASLSSQPPA